MKGPTIENMFAIVEKATLKKDGVYSYQGLFYRVKNSRFTHYAYRSEIVERAGHFNVTIGSYSGYSADARKALKKLQD